MRTFAPAKINLYLHVTGYRDNGYHELDSIVVFADVGDSIEVKRATKTTLEVVGPYASGLEISKGNLVLRAFEEFSTHIGSNADVALKLEKNLPLASGIGGGSSDAGATLKALIKLLGVCPDECDLFSLALDLGADVPSCLLGRPAHMSGIGEILEPIKRLPDLPSVLVNPGIGVSTSAVFKRFSAGNLEPSCINDIPSDIESLVCLLRDCRNDLYDSAVKIVPEIYNVLSLLEETSGCLLARMSGSGATCFGIYADTADARTAVTTIKDLKPHWWVKAAILQGTEE